jgi:hypothetical protein
MCFCLSFCWWFVRRLNLQMLLKHKQNGNPSLLIIRAPPYGGCPIVISLSVRASVPNEVFRVFSSPELKAQVSYSDRPLSVIRLSVRPSVRLSVRLSVNFYIFDFFSRTTGPILTRLGTNHPWGEGILNC